MGNVLGAGLVLSHTHAMTDLQTWIPNHDDVIYPTVSQHLILATRVDVDHKIPHQGERFYIGNLMADIQSNFPT